MHGASPGLEGRHHATRLAKSSLPIHSGSCACSRNEPRRGLLSRLAAPTRCCRDDRSGLVSEWIGFVQKNPGIGACHERGRIPFLDFNRKPTWSIKRVAILFAGGPAPAANAVISTAAASFRRQGIEVLGILHGYAHLVEYRDDHPMKEGPRLHRLESIEPQTHSQHARHPDRHLAHQSRQGSDRASPPGRSRADRPAPHGASGAFVAGDRCTGLDRRR